MKTGFCNHESGVSEIIGFILIISLMVTGIGLVTLYGYPVLLKEQTSANIRNMEKNLIVIQTDVNSLAYRNVPYKETALQVGGGTLTASKDPPTSPYFTVTHPDGTPILNNFYPGILGFQSSDGQTDVVLENGAVHINYWSDQEGSSMLSDPRWYYDAASRTLVIPMIRLNATSDMTQTGMGTVKMQFAGTMEYPPVSTPSGVLINYEPSAEHNYRRAWQNYLSSPNLGLTDVSASSSSGAMLTFANTSPVDTLIVKEYTVTILSLR